jgi:hypothetical protein
MNTIAFKLSAIYAINLDEDDITKMNSCFNSVKRNQDKKVRVNNIDFWITPQEYKQYEKTLKGLKRSESIKILLDGKYVLRKTDQEKVSPQEMNRLYAIVSSLEKDKSIISKLIRAHIYLELGFPGKVESILNSILQTEFLYDFYQSNHMYRLSKQVEDEVLMILKNIKELFDDKKLVDVLIAHLSFGIDQKLRSKIVKDFDVPNKLSYVQDNIRSVNYALRYPFVWSVWIEKYSSQVELEKYINKTPLFNFLEKGKYQYLGALRSSFTTDKSKREIILRSYKQLRKTKDPYLKDVMFRLDENEDFVKFIIRNEVNRKPIFLEKKNFFRTQVKDEVALLYTLYQLYKLGDIKEEYLIKSMATVNHGL